VNDDKCGREWTSGSVMECVGKITYSKRRKRDARSVKAMRSGKSATL